MTPAGRILSAALLATAFPALAQVPPQPAPETLFATVSALDAEVFDAFNRCSEPGQLAKHAGYFAEDVEFYHDTGGVTWNRSDMLANTEKHVCGKFSRELVPGTLVVFPVKDFGAIAQGTHRFCQSGTGQCEGEADFTMVWREQAGEWQLTRVLSYGHRPAAPDVAHGDVPDATAAAAPAPAPAPAAGAPPRP